MTNNGLRIDMPLISIYDHYEDDENLAALISPIRQKIGSAFMPIQFGTKHGIYLALLRCQHDGDPIQRSGTLGIYLQEVGDSRQEGDLGALKGYSRIIPNTVEDIDVVTNWEKKITELYVIELEENNLHRFRKTWCASPYHIKEILITGTGYALVDAYPRR